MPTISEQITQLTSDRDDLVANLTTKGITGLTGDETFTELVPEVLNIPSGGSEEWTPEPDWWDIEQILKDDTEDYPIKEIRLIDNRNSSTNFSVSRYGSTMKVVKVKTSDGAEYTSKTNHTWDTSKDKPCSKGYKTRYYILYRYDEESTLHKDNENSMLFVIVSNHKKLTGIEFGNTNSLQCLKLNNCEFIENVNSLSFSMCYDLRKIEGLNINNTTSSNRNQMFISCYRLQNGISLNNNSITMVQNFYNNCYNLKTIPELVIPSATSLNNILTGCYALEEISKINISSATSASIFSNCCNLKHIIFEGEIIGAVNFSICYNLDKESLLSILNHLKDLTGETAKSLTLGAKNLLKLTDQEKAIATNKNWTLN